ncbi:MAG: ABC transporter ATP-binding protein [Candidatus Hydrogenedentota bacterium]|nr:MAG: ABC transporter ATP-binding protein [Candidatus Hydrogenedentota bacterium]
MSIVLEAKNIKKVYETENSQTVIFTGLNFKLMQGEFVAIRGASGAGKSTLLNILGGLDSPSEGEVFILGKSLTEIRQKHKEHILHRDTIGFIFQNHYLMPEFTLLENVLMPPLIQGKSRKEAKKIALKALEEVGLTHRQHHFPNQISGGESQRAAVARVMAASPSIILADEPTGNLDPVNSNRLLDFLETHRQRTKAAIVMVTHSLDLAQKSDRILELENGHWK